MNKNNILHGSALDQLKALEADSVDCCITSPPYWSLRDYKTEGQLGLEPTFQEYIKKLVDIFGEVRRVLKKSGACWVNLGDTYGRGDRLTNKQQTIETNADRHLSKNPRTGFDKSLLCIPERFAIAMVDAGWILRNKIIWYKPNCMPSSAKDRFTVDWEYLFFFTKSQRYYFETQYEPIISNPQERGDYSFGGKREEGYGNPTYTGKRWIHENSPLGRIKRCVWKIATQPFAEAHFATFPPALVKTPLLATCPEYICKRCGKAREKILEHIGDRDHCHYTTRSPKNSALGIVSHKSSLVTGFVKEYKETGLTNCGCNAGFDGGIVLDPFMGSGTVALVAIQNARNFVGIELNQTYIKMAMDRLKPYLLQTRLL